MSFYKVVFLVCFLCSWRAFCGERYLTLTVGGAETNFLHIAEGEAAELVSMPAPYNSGYGRELQVFKSGKLLWSYGASTPGQGGLGPFTASPVIVSGPASFGLYGGPFKTVPDLGGNIPMKAICTIRIWSQWTSPANALVIPPGPGGGTLRLECSTNLYSWEVATNGIYVNEPTAKFFRLQLDRVFSPQAGPEADFGSAFAPLPDRPARGRMITWTPEPISDGALYEIPHGQALRLASVHQRGVFYAVKDNREYLGGDGFDAPTVDPLILAGPAKIKVLGERTAYTFELLPDGMDPQTTVVLPPGEAGGAIQLQSSTNLTDWVSSEPGEYLGLSSARFFRIQLKRVP